MPWLSKNDPNSRAHFVLDDGTTACAHDKLADGRPALAPFRCTWLPYRESSHLCSRCRKRHPRKCLCGACRIVPAAKRGPS